MGLGWLTGLIKPVTDVVGGAINKRAEARIAMEDAGYSARLGGWIDDAIIITFLLPLWMGIAAVFGVVTMDKLREMVGVYNLLLDGNGWYGFYLQVCIFIGLGVGLTRKVADKVIDKRVKELNKGGG